MIEQGRLMDTISDAAPARPTTVAFVNRFDATTYSRVVHLTPDEERRLRNVLAALRDYGFILDASFEPALTGYGFADLADHIRSTIGPPPLPTWRWRRPSAPSPAAIRRPSR
jgi:hypothetical protein